MFCGTRSFSLDDDRWAPSSPKEGKKKQGSSSSSSSNKNPYSNRGLDKFSAVLAELEARREKILAKTGSKDASMVRFMYSNSKEWVPIVIKLRDEKQEASKPSDAKKQPVPPAPAPPATAETAPEVKKVGKAEAAPEKSTRENKQQKKFTWGEKEAWWRWKPGYNWPMVMVLILLCLVVFGRVFAICCTSIWWYLLPTMQGRSVGNVRKSMKKDYGRRLSDKRLGVAGLGVHSQAKKAGEVTSPKQHGNGKRG